MKETRYVERYRNSIFDRDCAKENGRQRTGIGKLIIVTIYNYVKVYKSFSSNLKYFCIFMGWFDLLLFSANFVK